MVGMGCLISALEFSLQVIFKLTQCTCIPAGTPGYYTATISGFGVSLASGDSYSKLFMHLNGQQVDETRFVSGDANGGEFYYDQGSRTMVSRTDRPKVLKLSVQIFHMNEGDTLHIEVDQASTQDYFSSMNFCITLTTWDYSLF